MSGTTIGVALAGLGNVGREAARLLLARRAYFRRALGVDLRLAAVCDRDVHAESRRLGLPAAVRRTNDWRGLLEDPSIAVVAELFGGAGEARSLALAVLSSGRALVTANKLLLSRHWPQLARAERGSAGLFPEASVAGAIPVLQALREGLAADRIRSLRGILNGTSNFVLTEMIHAGVPMPEALARARRLGLAERDASLDLGGGDAAHKLSVLASTVTGRWLPPDRIPRTGIEALRTEDVSFALEKLGRTPRLIGTLVFEKDGAEAHVAPALVPLRHPLAGVHGAHNAVLVEADPAGDLMFYGLGAGPGPAASAVVGDMLRAARGLRAAASRADARPLRALAPAACAHYLRLTLADRPGALARVAAAIGRRGISISQVHQSRPRGGAAAVMIVTHRVAEPPLREALSDIAALGPVHGRPFRMRLLD